MRQSARTAFSRLLVVGLLLPVWLGGSRAESQEPRWLDAKAAAAFRVIVKLHPGVEPEALQAIDSGPALVVQKKLGPHLYLLEIEDRGSDALSRALEALSGTKELVEFAEPDYLVQAQQNLPDDPRFGEQWALHRADLLRAWSLTAGSRIGVAVLDTGVDYLHPDLEENIWTNPGEVADNGVDDDGNGFVDDLHGWDFASGDGDPMDEQGHGTQVAGVIGAVGNNGVGVAGVCWNAFMIPLRILGPEGTGAVSDAIQAVRYASRMGARVVCLSWGGTGFSRALKEALDEAGRAGVLFVAAAGNARKDNDVFPSYPAAYDSPNLVTVAASEPSGRLASFSNYGLKTVHLAAPGVGILSTFPGGDYRVADGTSMAAAQVAGIAALMRSRFPLLTHQQIKERVLASVDRRPGSASRLNVSLALRNTFRAAAGSTAFSVAAAMPAWSSEAFEEFVARPGFGQVAGNWTPWYQDANPAAPGEREWNIVNGESGWGQEFRKSRVRMGLYRVNSGFTPGATYRIQLRARWLTPPAATTAPNLYLGIHPGGGTDPNEVSWSGGMPVASKSSWSTLSAELTVPNASATIFIKVDYSNLSDYGVAIDNLSIQPSGGSGNQPPSVSLSTDKTTATAPGSFVLTASASDPDGTISKVDFYQGATLLNSDAASPYSFTWSGVGAGSYALTARAYDNANASSVSNAVNVTVNAPSSSTKSKLTLHAGWGGSSDYFIRNAKPRVVKLFDEVKNAALVKQLSPGTIVVGRLFPGSVPDGVINNGNPADRANDWWNTVQATVMAYPDVDYWEGLNEPVVTSAETMTWYAQFEIARVNILAANGRKACIANFATGNPDIALWPQFIPAIDNAIAKGGIMGLHEYGTPMTQYWEDSVGEGWLCGRYRKVYRLYLQGREIPLVITETGVDEGTLASTGPGQPKPRPIDAQANHGWQQALGTPPVPGFPPPGDLVARKPWYLDQLKWYDNILKQDGYVLGATIYQMEIPGWASFDVRPIVQELTDYVAQGSPNAFPTVSFSTDRTSDSAPGSFVLTASASDPDGFISKVEFYQGSTLLNTDSSSPYSYTWSGVAAGSYSLTAKAYDNAGASTVSSAVAVTVSAATNKPPTVSLSTDRSSASAPGSFVLAASASDPDGSVARVEFYQGSTLLNTDSSSPYSYTWSGVAAGSYSLTAKAYDNSGASATSNVVNVSVTSDPPVAGDPGLVWLSDNMDTHNGELVKSWSKWPVGGGPGMEWRIVPGEGGWWAQEVRKTNVNLGVSRPNRGFKAGDAYRLKFRARKTSGSGTPKAYAGVQPAGGTLSWGNPVSVASATSWVDVSYEFTASTWTTTLYLRADLTNLSDTGVAIDNVTVELLSPRDPEPWMISGAPPVEPVNIHGIHDAGAEDHFIQANRRGWVTEALEIESDPNNHSGRRFTEWIDGIGVVCRIAHRFGQILPDPGPAPQYPGLDAFAQRAANFVKSSVGCGIWSIGNEPHLERVPDPAVYAEAFVRAYRAIKGVRPQAKVITAGFVHGDLNYFKSALRGIESRGIIPDGIALHTYTDSQGWNEWNFRDYQVKIGNLPESMKTLPLYITEAGTGGPGNPTTNTGLINTMFNHVHQWNLSGGQQVRAVCIYRWTAGADKWSIEDNPGMLADFVASLANDYRWFPGSSGNQPPTVSLSSDKTAAQAPATFVLSATASDPDGTVARVEFFEGTRLLSTDATSPYSYAWSGVATGTYTLTAKAYDTAGASGTSNTVNVTVNSTPPPLGSLISNGDFSSGLSAWSVWAERGALNQGVNGQGQSHLQSGNHNGGLFQKFNTGGAGKRITVNGSWGSSPTQADYQWAEVLVINGPDLPAQGQDVVAGANVGQSPVVLIYKNDTFRSKSGWSGTMSQTAAVANVGAFTSAGATATIILKSGNMGTGKLSGTWFDNIDVK